jgi:hypothetical protein
MPRPAQALVEFALAIAVFMLLVLGTFDLARAYMAYTVIANAAREASRYGAVHVGEACWDTNSVRAGTNLAVGLDTTLVKLTVVATGVAALPSACAPAVCTPAQPPASLATLPYISVCGTYQFRSITPMVGALFGDPLIRVDTATLAG